MTAATATLDPRAAVERAEKRRVDAVLADRETYRDLLGRMNRNESEPDDEQLLVELLSKLGLAAADAVSDLEALRKIPVVETKLRKAKEAADAIGDLSDAIEEAEREAAKAKQRVVDLRYKASNRSDLLHRQRALESKIGTIKFEHPRMFAPADRWTTKSNLKGGV